MKRLLTLTTIVFAATMMNGCSKCSHEGPVQPPPVVEPVPTDTPTDAPPVPETMPTDSAPTETK